MKKSIINIISIIIILLCFVGCRDESEKEIVTGYIYNLEDKSTRTFSEEYIIEKIKWSPDSNYFIYNNYESKVRGDIKIKEVNNLEEINHSFENIKDSKATINRSYWSKDSKLIISLKDKGDFSFDPNTKVMEQASQEYNDNKISEEFTEDEVNKYKKEFNIPNENRLYGNHKKSRFYYITPNKHVIVCNISTGEKEVVFDTILLPQWSPMGDKIIYSVPKEGLESIEERNVYESTLFETYIYDFVKKEKIKVADFYASDYYCSPNEKYLIFVPKNYNNWYEM